MITKSMIGVKEVIKGPCKLKTAPGDTCRGNGKDSSNFLYSGLFVLFYNQSKVCFFDVSVS